MNKFIPRILSIWTAKFGSKIYLIPRILRICTNSFSVFSVHNRFVPRFSVLVHISFCIFGKCTQIISNFWNEIIFFTAFKVILLQKNYVSVQLDQRPTRNNWLFGPNLTTKNCPQILIIRGITFEFEFQRIQIYIRKQSRVGIRGLRVCFCWKKMNVENLMQVYL